MTGLQLHIRMDLSLRRLFHRFVIATGLVLIVVPTVAQNEDGAVETPPTLAEEAAADSTHAPTFTANVVQDHDTTNAVDDDQEYSTHTLFTISYGRQTGLSSKVQSLMLRVAEDSMDHDLITQVFPAIQLDVTSLGALFAPLVEAVAKRETVHPDSLSGGGKLSFAATITDPEGMIVKAINTWKGDAMPAQDTGSGIHRYYLTEAYNILSAFGDEDEPHLTSDMLKDRLRTAKVNRWHAQARDTESYQRASEDGSVAALERYLRDFPSGAFKGDAHKAIKEANDMCLGQAKQNRVRFRDCEDCPEMVVVPGGSFMIGSPEEDDWSADNERPRSPMDVADFAAGVYEITEVEYDRSEHKSKGSWPDVRCWRRTDTENGTEWQDRKEGKDEGKDDGSQPILPPPAVCVNWYDANDYAGWLSETARNHGVLPNETYRLLKEAEWEYVARAGTETRFHYGDGLTTSDANYCPDGGSEAPAACGVMNVGSFLENGFGLHDVHGNVWEWVDDTWSHNYESPRQEDGENNVALRVLRGGSWADEEKYLRSAMRGRSYPGIRTSFTGFRVARDLHACPSGVSLVAESDSLRESSLSGVKVKAQLDALQVEDVTVVLSVAGTAALGEDYTIDPKDLKLTISPPALSASLTLVPLDDDFTEGSEQIILTGTATGLRVRSTTVTLEDDETGVKLSVFPAKLKENGGRQSVVVTATPPEPLEDGDRTIALSLLGVAANGTDYSVTPEHPTISLKSGESTGVTTIAITPVADEANEGMGEAITICGREEETIGDATQDDLQGEASPSERSRMPGVIGAVLMLFEPDANEEVIEIAPACPVSAAPRLLMG